MHNKIFALDIGTRSVVGVILEKNDEHYTVCDVNIKEHSDRAMIDGQIHDVLAVAKTIAKIKRELEEKHGPLKKVSVAAAGRALKTEQAEVKVNINGKPLMKKEDILHLELQAVQQAQASAAQKNDLDKTNYYCVGYSILYYRLDGEEIGSLIDQQGDEASVEIIATFLPKVVVESLIAAIQRADLQMEALTLEPIAAINVLIPPSMRRLNVCLVDVGAGTSDIAITSMGTITAYGMVPIAGDEITETISDHYLLDFPLAESAKRQIGTNDFITVQDILGFDTEVPKEEILEQIESSVNKLASTICEEILLLNKNKPPQAVMLIGGGSLTPNLHSKIASMLQLPENRVALRGVDAISNLSFADHLNKGPELVTPVGIAISAEHSPVHYKTVHVNEQPVRLFEVNELTVADCLLAAGIKTRELYGKPGLAKIVTLNGRAITIPGKHGELPILTKNGQTCSLDDHVTDGDNIIVKKGDDGEEPDVQIGELLDDIDEKIVFINDVKYEVTPQLKCNGQVVTKDKLVEDRDEISYHMPKTIEQLFTYLNLTSNMQSLKPFEVYLDGRKIRMPNISAQILKNNDKASLHSTFSQYDRITVSQGKDVTVEEFALLNELPLNHTITVTFNNSEVTLSKRITSFYRNGSLLNEDDILHRGDNITMKQEKEGQFIFQDLFKYVEVELPEAPGGTFVLLRNDQEVTFYDQINHGDNCQIVWPERENNYENNINS